VRLAVRLADCCMQLAVRQVVQLVVRLAVCRTTCCETCCLSYNLLWDLLFVLQLVVDFCCGLLLWTRCWLSTCCGCVRQHAVTTSSTTNTQQIQVMESDTKSAREQRLIGVRADRSAMRQIEGGRYRLDTTADSAVSYLTTLRSHRLQRRLLYDARLQLKVAKTQYDCELSVV